MSHIDQIDDLLNEIGWILRENKIDKFETNLTMKDCKYDVKINQTGGFDKKI